MVEVSGYMSSLLRHPTFVVRYGICRNVDISTTAMPMATKLARMVTHHEGLLPIKSHDTWITWSF